MVSERYRFCAPMVVSSCVFADGELLNDNLNFFRIGGAYLDSTYTATKLGDNFDYLRDSNSAVHVRRRSVFLNT